MAPDQEIVLFVSEILSRIPFEALIDRESASPRPYFTFPGRSFNYFRSPWLFYNVFSREKTPETQFSESTFRVFTPLHPEPGEERDPFGIYTLADCNRDELKEELYQWFTSGKATRDKFTDESSSAGNILLESHCTFDRFQPFLSRLLFAGGEPLTIMDVFARHVFQVASLMIMIACESDQLYDSEIDRVGVSIAEAMLCKGVDRLVAPLWTVEQGAARRIIRKFSDHVNRGKRPIDALAEAQREEALIKSIHPYYWSSLKFSGLPGHLNGQTG